MKKEEFEDLVADAWLSAIPEKFRAKVKNVACIVEDEPSDEVRREEGLAEDETLLGRYVVIPATERGDFYGIGATLPDVITIYRNPIEDEAEGDPERIRTVIAETVWHEVAHYFGLDHSEIEKREEKRTRL